MVRGIYASGSGMITQSRKIDVLSNNMANISTPGFKRDNLETRSFDEQLVYSLKSGERLGSISYGEAPGKETTNLTAGNFEQTGRSADLAITSDGLFAVRGANGTEYTRSCSFEVDAQGYLALPTGQRLLGDNGEIRVGGDNFNVTEDGTVLNGGGVVGKIRLYNAGGAQTVKNADGLFTLNGAQPVNGTIWQGFIEDSNVGTVDEMTGLMASSRTYQSCQQAFDVSDQAEQMLVNQVAALK